MTQAPKVALALALATSLGACITDEEEPPIEDIDAEDDDTTESSSGDDTTTESSSEDGDDTTTEDESSDDSTDATDSTDTGEPIQGECADVFSSGHIVVHADFYDDEGLMLSNQVFDNCQWSDTMVEGGDTIHINYGLEGLILSLKVPHNVSLGDHDFDIDLGFEGSISVDGLDPDIWNTGYTATSGTITFTDVGPDAGDLVEGVATLTGGLGEAHADITVNFSATLFGG